MKEKVSPGEAADRRGREGGGARVHRHAGAVRAHHSRRGPSAVQDLPGHHDRGDRRGRLGGAALRCDGGRGPAGLRAYGDHRGLADLRPILRHGRWRSHGRSLLDAGLRLPPCRAVPHWCYNEACRYRWPRSLEAIPSVERKVEKWTRTTPPKSNETTKPSASSCRSFCRPIAVNLL